MMVTCIPRAELWADQLNQARHVGRDEGRQGATATFPAPICRATANAGGPSLTFRLAKHPAATACGASPLDAPEEYSITIECGCMSTSGDAGIACLVQLVMVMIEQERTQSNDFIFMALFARMDNIAIAAAVSLLFALGLPGATAVLLLLGASPGVPIGPNLSASGNILPGYSVTWLGSLIGAAWAGFIGAIA